MDHPAAKLIRLNTMIYCRDVGRSLQFYRALGLQHRAHIEQVDVHIMGVGEAELTLAPEHLHELPRKALWRDAKPRGHGVVIVLEVDDVLATFEAAKRARADVVQPPMDQAWGSRTLEVLDPDGYFVMFQQRLE